MYEDRTQKNILNELLEIVPVNVNKQEGTIIYAALAAASEKLEDAYIDLGITYNNCFADTCDREHLIRKGKERGIEPEKATHAIYKAVFNCGLDIGERFSQGKYNFIITEKITDLEYRLKCETAGKDANNCFGELTILSYNKGFESGTITELLIPAKDEQETEDFRQEYFATVASQTFAGNVAAYINEINKMEGIGYCKPIPHAFGGGTVGCIIINSEWQQPAEELVNEIQNKVDPETDINNIGEEYGLPELETYKGQGYGFAPINHSVLVAGVKNVEINIKTIIELKSGYNLSMIEAKLQEAVDKYFSELAKNWKNVRNIIVRKSYIDADILDIEGILDIKGTTINGMETIELEYNQIPIRGGIIVE